MILSLQGLGILASLANAQLTCQIWLAGWTRYIEAERSPLSPSPDPCFARTDAVRWHYKMKYSSWGFEATKKRDEGRN